MKGRGVTPYLSDGLSVKDSRDSKPGLKDEWYSCWKPHWFCLKVDMYMYSICIAGEWAITNPDFDIGSRPYNFIKNAMHFDLLRPMGVEYSHSGRSCRFTFCRHTELNCIATDFLLWPDRKLDLIIIDGTLSRLKKMMRDKIDPFDVSFYEVITSVYLAWVYTS